MLRVCVCVCVSIWHRALLFTCVLKYCVCMCVLKIVVKPILNTATAPSQGGHAHAHAHTHMHTYTLAHTHTHLWTGWVYGDLLGVSKVTLSINPKTHTLYKYSSEWISWFPAEGKKSACWDSLWVKWVLPFKPHPSEQLTAAKCNLSRSVLVE